MPAKQGGKNQKANGKGCSTVRGRHKRKGYRIKNRRHGMRRVHASYVAQGFGFYDAKGVYRDFTPKQYEENKQRSSDAKEKQRRKRQRRSRPVA